MTTPDIIALIEKEQAAGKMPAGLSRVQLDQLARALQKYSADVGERVIQKILDDWQKKISAAQSATVPAVQGGVIYNLGAVASEDVAGAIRFALKISQDVAQGAGIFLNQNLSPGTVQKWPALEFSRLIDVDVPRGEKRGPKGTIIAVPDEDWPTRWAAAGAECGDQEWAPWDGDAQDGRGVALKSSGIWQALGDGAGGYTDTLGNAFPPFAFNSGFRTSDVDRTEAEELGLIEPDDYAQPAKIDYEKLFDLHE